MSIYLQAKNTLKNSCYWTIKYYRKIFQSFHQTLQKVGGNTLKNIF